MDLPPPEPEDGSLESYYRPFSSQSTTLPDILIHDELQTLPPKRKASAVPTSTSIRERVKQLEQAKSGASRSVSASHVSSKPPSKLQKMPSRDRTQNGDLVTASRNHRDKNASSRHQPLFGEVTAANGVGYGIPSLTKQRSNLETSMPHSTTSSRSHSSTHHHSSSEDTEIEVDGSSVDAAPESFSPSRIPVPRTRRASDLGVPHNMRPKTPVSSSSPRQDRSPGLKTPGVSSRRYSPKRHLEPNSTLTAIIREPPPKLSPPLRSSKPRLPVSAASTAASRAKVAERFTTTIAQQPAPRSAPKDFVKIDLASRRDAVQSHLARTYLDAKSNRAMSSKGSPATKHSDSPQFPGAFPESPTDYFDEDAAPGAANQEYDPFAAVSPPRKPQSHISEDVTEIQTESMTEDECSSILEDEPMPLTEDFDSNGQPYKMPTLTKNIYILREESPPNSPEPEYPEDILSEVGERETINVVLSATPVLPNETFQAPEPSPIPELDEEEFDFADGRSSICPDDSVSVVFQERMRAELKRHNVPPVPALPDLLTENLRTLDSAERSEINRVLLQYQRTPKADEPQSPAYNPEPSPGMAAHMNWGQDESSHHPGSQPASQTLRNNLIASSCNLVRPDSIMAKEIMEEEPRGTAIIFTNDKLTNDDDNIASQSSDSTIKQSDYTSGKLQISTTSPIAEETPSSNQPSNHSRPRVNTSGLGLAYDYQSEQQTTSPAAHSPAPPVHAPPPPPGTFSSGINPHRMSMEITQLGRGSWQTYGASSPVTTPVPRTRVRKDTYDTDSSSLHRASRTSKPDTLNSAPRASVDATISEKSLTLEKSTTLTKEEKRLKTRWNTMKELVDTEHKFFHDMIILVDIFMATASAVPTLAPDDRRCIFGNTERVRETSAKFLDALKKSVNAVYQIPTENRFHAKRGSTETSKTGDSGKAASTAGLMPDKDVHISQDRKTTVGLAFLEHAEELNRVYRSYMINHSSSNKRRMAIMQDKQVQMWLKECVDCAKDISDIWSLDSMTIKPTQRYLKYPLLLKQILENTPQDHPDHTNIAKALKVFTSASENINDDAKKREITGTLLNENKQEKPKESSLMQLLRLRGRPNKPRGNSASKVVTPYTPQVSLSDNSYEAIRQRFGGHFFQVQIFMRDYEKYLEDQDLMLKKMHTYALQLKANYRCDPHNRFPEWESRTHMFVELIESIQRHAFPEHVARTKKFVIDPIFKLWKLHAQPQQLMAKHRKLKVSFQKYRIAEEKKDLKGQDKYREEARTWEVLNDVLVVELPQLYANTKELVHATLTNHVAVEKKWWVTILNKLKHFCGDYDPKMFFDNDCGAFYKAVIEEFRRDTEEVDCQLANMVLAQPQCEGSEDITIGLPEPEGGFEPMTETDYYHRGHRPSKSSGKRPTNLHNPYSSRASGEHAARSTPNLNLGAGAHTRDNSINRLSDHQANFSTPIPGFLGQADSAPGSAGPPTPGTTGTPGSSSRQREAEPFVWRPIGSQPAQISYPSYAFSNEENQHMYRELDAVKAFHAAIPKGAREPPRFASALPGDWPATDWLAQQQQEASSRQRQPSSVAHSRTPSQSQPVEMPGEDVPAFVAASLFEFRIDSNLRERGYPYLQYVAGDVFDVVRPEGELWLARNQDDPSRLGWIWEKHFALLPTS